MKTLLKIIKIRLKNNTGASATEYGILVAGVALALIFVFFALNNSFNEGFQFILEKLSAVFNN